MPGCDRSDAQAESGSLPIVPVCLVKERVESGGFTEIGTVKAGKKTQIPSRVGGYIEYIAVEEGRRVGKGDLIMKLSNPSLGYEIKRTYNTIKQFKSEKKRLESQIFSTGRDIERYLITLRRKQSEVDLQELQMEEKKKELSRLRELYSEQAVSRSELESLKSKTEEQKIRLDIAKANLASAQIGYRDNDIEAAGYGPCKSKNDRIGFLSKIHYSGLFSELVSLEIKKENAELELGNLNRLKNNLEIRSPVEGSVFNITAFTGSYVEAGTHLCTILNKNKLHIECRFPEQKRDIVRPGSQVTYNHHDSQNHGSGTVLSVSAVSSPSSASIFAVIEINEPSVKHDISTSDNSRPPRGSSLFPGTLVDVNFKPPKETVYSAVPETAVAFDKNERSYLYVLHENILTKRFVKLGETDGKWIELLKGPEPGTQILCSRPEFYNDGMEVEVQK
ncbi:MAG: efflux RND transporter periplasmic adaptor subunit [Spirochaetales bacterium]|nr:efflux RND transporter periplasmic adaptor subunit [Spirochaetales bacterium]